jgi:hypothetical protein
VTTQPGDSTAPWRIKGDWWDLCNCAVGCPCLFGENPTLGYCQGVLTYIIREGRHGDVSLDGLTVIFVVHFEGELFDKNREIGVLIDGLGGPFRKFLVPDGETCRIYNTPRPEVVPGFVTIGHALRNIITGPFGRNWDWTGRSSKHIGFDLSGPDDFSWKNE